MSGRREVIDAHPVGGRPDPSCLVCKPGKACGYHEVGNDPVRLLDVLRRSLSSTDGAGLVRYFLAGVCSHTAFATEVLPLIERQDAERLAGAVGKLSVGELDSRQLRQLAATALALAVVLDTQDYLEDERESARHG